MSDKVKFPLYLPEAMKAEVERRYQEDGSRSQTEFVEHAVGFYLDYLSANNSGAFLPTAVKSALDGRIGMFEDRMASLLFKLSYTVDTLSTINAHAYEYDEDTLRRFRADSIQNVKRVNGILSFEQYVRNAEKEKAAWQD